ncbi:MAG TPA: TetR family transcriptional regulator [Paenalcaligenes sp.]|nr:TetR family transcriptional regulator [Paenalcaligenes sp.]
MTLARRSNTGSDEKRQAILDAAAEVFMTLGFSGASLDDISDHYGATKGIIYYHFRNKTYLFFAVLHRAMVLTQEAIEPPSKTADSAAKRLYAMAKAHTHLIMNHLAYLRVSGLGAQLHMSGRTSESEREQMREITRMRDENEGIYLRVINEGIESGEFRAANGRIAVKSLLGALNWTSRWYRPYEGENQEDRDKLAREIAAFSVHAFLPSNNWVNNEQ